MTKNIIHIVLFTCITFLSVAQLQVENLINGGENSFQELKNLAISNDTSIYVLGVFQTQFEMEGEEINSDKDKAVFLAKFDQNNNLSWLKRIAENEYTVVATLLPAFAIDTSGNIVIAINYSEKLLFFGDSVENQKVELFKLDSDGNLLWNNSLSVESVGKNGVAVNLQNEIILTGQLDDDVFIQKYDENGNLIWTRTAGSNSVNDAGELVKTDIAGNIYITGFVDPTNSVYFESQHVPFPVSAFSGSFIAKYDNSGNLTWVQAAYTNGFGSYGGFTSLETIENGKIVVGGGLNGSALYFSPSFQSVSNVMNGYTAGVLMIIDSDGSILLAKRTFNNYSGSTGVMAITKFDNFSFFTVNTNSGNIVVQGDTINAGTYNDVLIAKYDTDGNIIWYYTIDGSNKELCHNIIFKDSALYLLGASMSGIAHFNSVPYNFGYSNSLFLAKFEDVSLGIEENSGQFTLYPNPNSGSFQLKTEQNLSGKKLRIVNKLGQEVYRALIENDGTILIQTDLNPGVYFLHCEGVVTSLVIQ